MWNVIFHSLHTWHIIIRINHCYIYIIVLVQYYAFPLTDSVTVTVAVKTASEMTYIVSSVALNSTPTNQPTNQVYSRFFPNMHLCEMSFFTLCIWHIIIRINHCYIYRIVLVQYYRYALSLTDSVTVTVAVSTESGCVTRLFSRN